MYQEEEDEPNPYGITVGTFVHFHKNPTLCARFVDYVRRQYQYTVNQFCCGGEGCRINNVDEDTAYRIKCEFLQNGTDRAENTVIYSIPNK